MKTRKTSMIEKLMPSVVNAIIALAVSLPFLYCFGFTLRYKLILILIFWLYNLAFIIFNKNRDLGMMVVGTYWEENYPLKNQLIYSVLYTLSFATIVIWIWFPFDLLLINLIFFQLPTVLTKKTTLHGYLSGNMATLKKTNIK